MGASKTRAKKKVKVGRSRLGNPALQQPEPPPQQSGYSASSTEEDSFWALLEPLVDAQGQHTPQLPRHGATPVALPVPPSALQLPTHPSAIALDLYDAAFSDEVNSQASILQATAAAQDLHAPPQPIYVLSPSWQPLQQGDDRPSAPVIWDFTAPAPAAPQQRTALEVHQEFVPLPNGSATSSRPARQLRPTQRYTDGFVGNPQMASLKRSR
jgi:hypothetical protein